MSTTDPEVSWEAIRENGPKILFDSLTNVRVPALKKISEVLRSNDSLLLDDKSTLQAVAHLTLKSYNYYQDSASRAEATNVLINFVKYDSVYLKGFVKYISDISAKLSNLALTDVLNLLNWANEMAGFVFKSSDAEEQTMNQLIAAQAACLYSCAVACYEPETLTKKSLHKKRAFESSFSQTKHAFTTTLASLEQSKSVALIDKIASIPLHEASVIPSAALLYLSVLADALIDLQPEQPSFHDHLKRNELVSAAVISYFSEQVLLAKVPPTSFSIALFSKHYMPDFVLHEAFVSSVLPNLEKSILRSSENGFSHLTVPLFAESNETVDLSAELASSKLFNQIITGLKSTKETVRSKASETLSLILQNNTKNILDEDAGKVITELFKAVKSTSNSDIKVLILESAAHLDVKSPETASCMLSNIIPLALKDANEHTLTAMARVFCAHYAKALSNNWTLLGDLEPKVVDQLKSGLNNPKLILRKVWAVELGEALFREKSLSTNERAIKLFEELYPILWKSFEEGLKSPLLMNTNKGIACAFVLIALCDYFKNPQFVDTAKVYGAALDDSSEKVSLLVSPKLLAKVTGVDQVWYLRSLHAAFPFSGESVSYGVAFLYFAISKSSTPSVRLEALSLLRQLLSSYPEKASAVFVQSISQVLDDCDSSNVDQEAADINYNLPWLSPVLNAVVQVENKDLAVKNLIGLLVPAHHPLVKAKDQWIGLALRSSIDPGSVVKQHASKITESLLETIDKSVVDGNMFRSACKAFASIGFVDPEDISPSVANILEKDLSLDVLDEIDAQSLAIWQAPEGEVVVDVLSDQKSTRAEDKNAKDYATRKWEEGLKKELAEKKGPKKLTREEQLKVKEQLAKESTIRASITSSTRKYHRAFRIIKALTVESPRDVLSEGGSKWFFEAVTGLLNVANHQHSTALFGDLVCRTFIGASHIATSRLGALREMTGVAALRYHNAHGIPGNFLEMPLVDLLSKVLFRVKMLSDDYLDKTSFIYVLPLLTSILQHGKEIAQKSSRKQAVTSEFAEEDPEEEQLMLTVDIISSLASSFGDDTIPRETLLKSLISLMQTPAKGKMAKECFLTICQQISVNIGLSDLHILLSNIVTPDNFVKTAILQGLDSEFDISDDIKYSDELWIACHDTASNVADLAKTIWEDNSLELTPEAPHSLLSFFGNPDSGLRLTVAKAYVAAVYVLKESEPAVFNKALDDIIGLFHEKEVPPPPKIDKYGLPIRDAASEKDRWEERSTVALALKHMATFFESQDSIEKVFNFLIEKETLGDKEELVGQELLDAGVEIIKAHGIEHVETLIPVFEKCLGQEDKQSVKQDRIRERVIILYGSLGRYLSADDKRLKIITDRLLATLDTPSEDVQYAVSECIAPLSGAFEANLQDHLDALFTKLWKGPNLAVRQGAAYGIAGLVKGAGIKSLFANDVMRNITNAADDKRNDRIREGVSLVLDCLSQSLGPMFEPYVIETLPIILKSLGDSSNAVREATDMAARQIMKNTTSYGVKKMIPLAISNLDDIAWRSKKGSVELLGSMAYLDPAQLSASLSTIVPEIVGVLNDTHKEVRKAAEQALKRFGDVIRNPEIHEIVPDLIRAIGDPTNYTDVALDRLIKTQFVHYIDGPSLALIIHVIHRGMRERSANTKKKACQIVGNMAILVDSKDLLPYLSSLVDELEVAMVDPVPATRSTGARALGSLVEKLGEEHFPTLIPGLVETLKDKSKAGDRLGSAQALSEVIAGLGLTKLDEMLPSILANASSNYSHIRAGFIPLLLFLPVCFGSQFAPYLSSIIPPILAGLADTDEEIHDTSLKAARLIVKNYANKAVDLLLPELERGLADVSYRIRLSSVELTGDLLFQITGISGKNELSEEQGQVAKSLMAVLGQERRDRILSALFICRADTSGVVRSAAIEIWKALVANTPKTVKEIIPSLTQIIVKRCASSEETHRVIAASTLGEVVRRVGANALAQLLPSLEESLISGDSDAKQGICIALSELISSSSEEALASYQDVFIRIIRDSLIDASPNVREAAAQAFEALQEKLGKVVTDELLPNLLGMLESDESENALLALQDIMATRSDVIFPILIPKLLTPPIDVFKVKALSALASVAGQALYSRLPTIINTLLQAVIDAEKNGTAEEQAEVQESFDRILLSIDDDDGVHPIMQHILSLVKHQEADKRAAICGRLGSFFANTTLDYSIYVQDLVSHFILSLGDKDPKVVQGVFDAMCAMVKAQDKPMLEKLVKPAHQSLTIAGVKGENLPGFALPKGPSCVLPIFSHGLMYGNAEQKELSALSMAEVIDRTPAENLRPFATTMTGPLIRVIGEKVSSDIKHAILTALTNLLLKIPQFLRPFIPQLQRTIVRSLGDPTNDKLRNGAVVALSVLVEFQPRVDPLVTELVSGTKNSEDQGVKTAMLKGLLQVVLKGGKNMSETSKASVMALVEEEINVVNDKSAVAYARLLGSLSQILSSEEASNILKNKILNKRNDASEMKFAVLSINSFLKDSPKHIFETGLVDEIVHFIISCTESTVPYISDNATVAIGKLLLLQGENKDDSAKQPWLLSTENVNNVIDKLCKAAMKPESNSPDTRRLALVVLRTISRIKYTELVKPHANTIVPSVFTCLRDSIIPIRLAAEKAYLAVFNLIDDVDMTDFTAWFDAASKGPITTLIGTTIQPRSIGDYTKRVASRLASVERERLEDGGDAETMFSDRFEDEKEIWAVGGF